MASSRRQRDAGSLPSILTSGRTHAQTSPAALELKSSRPAGFFEQPGSVYYRAEEERGNEVYGLQFSGNLQSALNEDGRAVFVVLSVLAIAAETGDVAVLERILADASPRDLFRLHRHWSRMPQPKPSWFVDVFISRLAEELCQQEQSGDSLRSFSRTLVSIGGRVNDKEDGSAACKAFTAAAYSMDVENAAEIVMLMLQCGFDMRFMYWAWSNRSWLHRCNRPFPLHILLMRLGKERDLPKRTVLMLCIDRVVRCAGRWIGKSDDYANSMVDNPIYLGIDAAFKRRDIELLQVMASWGISEAHRRLHSPALDQLCWISC